LFQRGALALIVFIRSWVYQLARRFSGLGKKKNSYMGYWRFDEYVQRMSDSLISCSIPKSSKLAGWKIVEKYSMCLLRTDVLVFECAS
jgi:hypothetical protein